MIYGGAQATIMPATQVGGLPARHVPLKGPDTYHIPSWRYQDDPTRVKALRGIVLEYGRDPRVATLAVEIVKAAGVPSRDSKGQAQALLSWVQQNVYYVNEPGERLQSPEYTLRVKYGDCDDMAILLAALFESMRLPWKFVLSGSVRGKPVRWVEGEPIRRGVKWAHIYLTVADRPFGQAHWAFAEPTLPTVKLGWDVVGAAERGEKIPLPELQGLGDLRTDLVKVATDLRSKLHWSNLVVTVVVSSVTLALTGMVLTAGKGALKRRRKRRR